MTRQSYFANEHNVSMEIKLREPRAFRSQSQCIINSFVGSEQITSVHISDLAPVTWDRKYLHCTENNVMNTYATKAL